MVFHLGSRGIGYYTDTQQTRDAARAAAAPEPTATTTAPGRRPQPEPDGQWWARVEFGPAAWWTSLSSQADAHARGEAGGSLPNSSRAAAGRSSAGPSAAARFDQIRSDFDPTKLPFILPPPALASRWSTNNKEPEPVERLRHSAMPAAYTSPVTSHVPVMHFHQQQLERAAAAGARRQDILAEGPDPHLHFQTAGYAGPPEPQRMADLFRDPHDWERILAWYRAYCAEIQRVERGAHKFRLNAIPGGREGLTIPASARKEQYRRLIWSNCNGKPVAVTPQLPDSNTTIRLQQLYTDSMRAGVNDIELISMMALYGMVSNATMSLDTVLLPNYKGGFDKLAVLQQAYRDKRDGFGNMPRVTSQSPQPSHEPSRLLPKGCAVQVKDDGRVKFRETVDGGAKRRARTRQRWLRRLRTRQLDSLVDRIEAIADESTNKPGVDSPNGSMVLGDLAAFKWGSVDDFGNMCDILAASGEPVVLLLYDFAGYFLQIPRGREEWWWHEECVSSAGSHVATRGSFGMGDIPNYASRLNYVVNELIKERIRTAQREFPAERVPAHVQQWMHERAAEGQSIDWYCDCGFFDDNTFACFDIDGEWPDTVHRICIDTWAEYGLDISADKTRRVEFGSDVQDPVLGVIIDIKARQRRLPDTKVKKYSEGVDDIIKVAGATRRRLVPKKQMQQVLGRLLFAMRAGVPTMWKDFLALLSMLASNWSDTYLRLHNEASDLLKHMQWRLNHENGTHLTPYTLRPGADGRPVIVGYSDAGLQGKWPDIQRAGYGGFAMLHRSQDLFFFHGTWNAATVRAGQIDINDAETMAAGYCADVADRVTDQLGNPRHYFYSIGDSAVHHAHQLVRDKATSAGLRWLYRQRAEKDAARARLTCTLHVTREFNACSDALAAGDIERFQREARFLLGPDVRMHEVAVPNTDIEHLAAFKSAYGARR